MKAAAFDLVRPVEFAGALDALAVHPGARAMAGGQSLGPMLNLRLARPEVLVQLGGIDALGGAEDGPDAVTIGACVTHAAIEDGRTPDIGGGVLARIAGGIAYRAVRNRGTIGGSLCHADPAADWVTTLMALDASVLIRGGAGVRSMPLENFVLGAFRTELQLGELLEAARIPRLPPDVRFGYFKACRKPGEFAHAMAAVVVRADGLRAVIGATGNKPVAIPHLDDARGALERAGVDPIGVHMQLVALRRAMSQAGA